MSIEQTLHFNTVVDTSKTVEDKLNLLLKLVEEQCYVLDIIQNPIKFNGLIAFINSNN